MFALQIVLIQSACGPVPAAERLERAFTPIHIPADYQDPALEPAYREFVDAVLDWDAAITPVDSLRLELVDVSCDKDESQVGFCERREGTRRLSGNTYLIRRVTVARCLTDFPHALRRTVFHELGHCVLDLGHDDARTRESIMYHQFARRRNYPEPHWSDLVREMMTVSARSQSSWHHR